MAAFIVATVNPDPRVDAAIAQEFPGRSYRFSDRVSFVEAKGSAADVAGRLGVKTRVEGQPFDGVTNIVVNKLAPSYYGFYGKDLWDWLQGALEREV